MKMACSFINKSPFLATVCGALGMLSVVSAFSQGSLTPSGPPAPIMKSLDQIEPRTAISFPGVSINSPGSYYLTTNLVGFAGFSGITISSGNVTLDLNGFAIMGAVGSVCGINIPGNYTNIVVRNGTISNCGTNGVRALNTQNVVLQKLIVSASGSTGISINNGSIIDCSILNNGGAGITITGNGSLILRNLLSGNNARFESTSFGIIIQGANNRIEENHITGGNASGYGIEYDFGGAVNNVIVKNSVIGNGANNYSGGAGNDVGTIGTANSGPWANFTH